MANKKILILGATGGTGRQILSRALEAGHEVTALVRNPEGLADVSSRVRLVTGNVLDDTILATAIRGQDVVISALGSGKSLKSSDLIAKSVPAIVRAMENEQVRRLILTSAYGVGETIRDAPLLPRIMMRLLLHNLYLDKAAGEVVLRRSNLDWTIVYPVILTNGPLTGRYRFGERLSLRGLPRVSRADVATFILTQVEDRSYIQKGVLVSS